MPGYSIQHKSTAYKIRLTSGQSIVVENIDGHTSYVLDDDDLVLSYSNWGAGFQDLHYSNRAESDSLRCGEVFLMRNFFTAPDIDSLCRVLNNVNVRVESRGLR